MDGRSGGRGGAADRHGLGGRHECGSEGGCEQGGFESELTHMGVPRVTKNEASVLTLPMVCTPMPATTRTGEGGGSGPRDALVITNARAPVRRTPVPHGRDGRGARSGDYDAVGFGLSGCRKAS
ncbi:hypothetical protein GCM10010388_02360 [Streptomyces mauvecolor]